MFFDTKTVPTRKELRIDLAAFGATVVAAIVQGWEAADIVWASWIASLLTGLMFFLILSLKKLREYTVATTAIAPIEGTEGPGEAARARTESGDERKTRRKHAGEKNKGGDAPKPMEGNAGCQLLAVGGLMALLAWFAGPGLVRVTLITLVGLHVIASVVGVLARRGWLGVSLQRRTVRALFFLPTSLFMFFFFLVHFGLFHLGHAVFLSFFVPPPAQVAVAADSAVADTMIAGLVPADARVADTLAVGSLVADSMRADSVADQPEVPIDMGEAWDDVREGLVEARRAFYAFLGLLILTYWPYILSVAARSFGAYREALLAKSKRGEEMLLPYKYVVRVHLLIFVLIPLAALGSGLVLTIAALTFFFFPVESVVAWAKSR